MLTMTVTFDLTALYFVAVNVIAILIYVLIIKHRARRDRRNVRAISNAIVDYLRGSGVEVSVECMSRPGGKRFVAFIDAEPSKQFRHTHIVEITLCNHVQTACGLELEKVYWRFPFKEATHAASRSSGTAGEAGQPAESDDEYMEEGLLRLKKLPEYEVTETSWAKFKEASLKRPRKSSPA